MPPVDGADGAGATVRRALRVRRATDRRCRVVDRGATGASVDVDAIDEVNPLPEPSPGTCSAGQLASTRAIASCSARVTHSRYFDFTAICRATYAQRNRLFDGS